MLDQQIKEQLKQYLGLLESDLIIQVSLGDDKHSIETKELVDEISHMSDRIAVEETVLERTPSFTIAKKGETPRVTFAGVPLGHEFTSLVMALLQVSGRAPKIDDSQVAQIKSISKELNFTTYVSLSCHNCPDVVQALNIMSVLNPHITHTMVEGTAHKAEVESENIMAVPAVYLNGAFLESGRMTLDDLLALVSQGPDPEELNSKEPFDVLVVGGGPSGATSAIYAARKGIRTGLVADRFGGQVMDTLGIENFIGMPYTEGPKLMGNVEAHVNEYDVDVMKSLQATGLKKNDLFEVELENGAVLKSKTVILSTGARWRNINVPGEKEFKNKGVAYCPHCDGPLFEGKHVAVIGGGNSGIEAAIDLAGIVKHVTVVEFLPELKADQVLQDRLNSLPNVTVIKNAQTTEITGDETVNGLSYKDRDTGEEHHIALAGVFVQIGLIPNTDWLGDTVDRNRMGEIIVDKHGQTSLPGVFAAGDCTDTPYKQIIISMGSGATASLGAFDYLIRN
ncbi:NADH dehydrogenase [Halolactibacillus alkaliphilus]|uniref:NADH dehydrogenase n=1 Tax=Halolactibacillus alkaliphilus TaxID=442899 RepID=A0A511WXJ9_9BACI|nr:alkyl hydroperoxide reductase subunit F [Halolactibacillus alkaliphilus]GEN55844.1 NADH dehydrogenase [Halolactibacillus alkaliphilus]GGN65961.1 NADH dehydrogenase [Halolactibacillus alkaliphilus]SFO66533.1 alkyl hydroperoxide reductase subunit F [Halolactibacillus alkaliphilus]